MRLFVALAVPDAEKSRILAATNALRTRGLAVRWLEPDAWHLTLKFLGEASEAGAAAVASALHDVAARHAPFELRLRGAGAFPGARRPGVWWIGVVPSESLSALQQDVEATVSPLGYPTEARPFAPHLTIGRTQRGALVRDAEPLLRDVAFESSFTVRTVDLMRSHLSPRGARYERLLAAELGS